MYDMSKDSGATIRSASLHSGIEGLDRLHHPFFGLICPYPTALSHIFSRQNWLACRCVARLVPSRFITDIILPFASAANVSNRHRSHVDHVDIRLQKASCALCTHPSSKQLRGQVCIELRRCQHQHCLCKSKGKAKQSTAHAATGVALPSEAGAGAETILSSFLCLAPRFLHP